MSPFEFSFLANISVSFTRIGKKIIQLLLISFISTDVLEVVNNA